MKKIKFIQINIFKGKYLDSLVAFLAREDPDFIAMQEVTTRGFNLMGDKDANLFEELSKRLGMDGVYHGDLKLRDDPLATFGNAVFSKHKILSKNVVVLKTFEPVTLEELDGESASEIRPLISRHLLAAQVNLFGKEIEILSWHGAWTAPPVDTAETLRQSRLVANYLSSLKTHFILGGDLNNTPDSKTVGLVSKVANNLMFGSSVVQTTHPKIHKIAPRGFLIDYVFVSPHFRLVSIKVPQVLISDHLPVVAVLEI